MEISSHHFRNVCRKHEVLQYEVEKAEENLSNKAVQKEQVVGIRF